MRSLLSIFLVLSTSLVTAQSRIPAYFYMHMKGNINENFNIKVDIVKRADSLYGHYEYMFSEYDNTSYYFYIGNIIPLKGVALPTGTLRLFEPPFGKGSLFEGGFVTQKHLSGFWIGPDGNLKIPFDLYEDYASGSVPLNVFSIKDSFFLAPKTSQPKAMLDLLLLFPAESGNMVLSDSLRKIIGGKFSEGDPVPTHPDTILNNIRNKYFSNFKVYQSPQPGTNQPGNNWNKSKIMEVILNDGHLLTLKILNIVSSQAGEVKKMTDVFTIHLKHATMVDLQDLIRTSYLPKIYEIVENETREKFQISPSVSLKSAGFFADHITTFEHVFVTRQGIGFYFNEYSVASPEVGSFEVIVPFQEISEGLLKDGVLSGLFQ